MANDGKLRLVLKGILKRPDFLIVFGSLAGDLGWAFWVYEKWNTAVRLHRQCNLISVPVQSSGCSHTRSNFRVLDVF
jgi:hypothetical protein